MEWGCFIVPAISSITSNFNSFKSVIRIYGRSAHVAPTTYEVVAV